MSDVGTFDREGIVEPSFFFLYFLFFSPRASNRAALSSGHAKPIALDATVALRNIHESYMLTLRGKLRAASHNMAPVTPKRTSHPISVPVVRP